MNSTKVKHGFILKFKQGLCKNKINTINKISHSLSVRVKYLPPNVCVIPGMTTTPDRNLCTVFPHKLIVHVQFIERITLCYVTIIARSPILWRCSSSKCHLQMTVMDHGAKQFVSDLQVAALCSV